MILDILKAFIYGCAIGGVIYLTYAVSKLQDKLCDLTNEVNKLKKQKPEQKKAKWIDKDHKMLGPCPRCTNCGGFNPIETRYCPNCGAKMEE